MSHTDSGDDPNFAPYPGRYEAARIKGTAPNEEPVLLDITGTADLKEQTDKVFALLERWPAIDGGLSVDTERWAVTVRLVGPVDGSSVEVERVKGIILSAVEGIGVEFQSVRYSRRELLRLADDLFGNPYLPGIGGGWDTSANRVRVLVGLGTETTQTVLDRLRAFEDDRICVETYVPTGEDWTSS
jgi:hypothetical protein